MGKMYAGGDIKTIKITPFEEGKESEGLMSYGVDIVEYIKKLKAKLPNPIKGNYDHFLEKVLEIIKTKSIPGGKLGEGVLLNPDVRKKITELCKEYIKLGKDDPRVKKIAELCLNMEKVNRVAVLQVTDCKNRGTFKGRSSGEGDELYEIFYVDGTHHADIEKGQFEGITAIKTVSIGPKIELIRKEAFKDCTNVSEIIIRKRTGSKDLNIEKGAFDSRANIKKVICPEEYIDKAKEWFPRATVKEEEITTTDKKIENLVESIKAQKV